MWLRFRQSGIGKWLRAGWSKSENPQELVGPPFQKDEPLENRRKPGAFRRACGEPRQSPPRGGETDGEAASKSRFSITKTALKGVQASLDVRITVVIDKSAGFFFEIGHLTRITFDTSLSQIYYLLCLDLLSQFPPRGTENSVDSHPMIRGSTRRSNP